MKPAGENADAALLVEWVRILAIAWRNLAAYPPGHQARTTALDAAHRRLSEALAPAGRLALGIAADGLVFGEEKLQSPQALKLAQALYRRSVAVLTIEEGLAPAELDSFLHLLAEEGGSQARPLWDALHDAGVQHVRLQPVDYSAVTVADSGADTGGGEEPNSLWDAILDVLIAGRSLAVEGLDVRSRDVRSATGMASLLEGVFGTGTGTGPGPGDAEWVARIAEATGTHLGDSRGAARQVTAQQITNLARSLPREVREIVVTAAIRAVTEDDADGQPLMTLASALSPDSVLQCLRKLSAEGTKLSAHALRLAQALAPPPTQPDAADEPRLTGTDLDSLLGEVRTLYGEEDIDRFNPEQQKALYERVVLELGEMDAREPSTPEGLGDRVESLTDDALDERLAPTLLELLGLQPTPDGLEPILVHLVALFGNFVSTERLEPAAALIEGLQETLWLPHVTAPARAAMMEAVQRMASRDSVLALLGALERLPEVRAPLVRRLIDLLGAAAARNCLLALGEETNRSRRRRLFDLLVSLGPVIAPSAAELLSDGRWFVVRNMILLLRAVGDRTSLPEIERCAKHVDLRVRLEAIKSLFTFGAAVPREMLELAIHDPDPKVAEAAVALVGQYGITEAVEPLLEIVLAWDPFGRKRSIRLKALRALGDLAVPEALPLLDRFLRNPRFLAWAPLEERRAAFKSLESYAPAVRLPFVQEGLRSRDPEIRRICARLSQSPVAVRSAAEGLE